MNEQKKKNIRLVIMIIIVMALNITLMQFAYLIGIMDNNIVELVTFISIGIAIFVLGLLAKTWWIDIGAGIPIKDERSKRVMEKAAASSFLFMIYFLLSLGVYDYMDGIEIIPRHTSAAGILGGAAFLFIMWGYYNWRGVDA